MLKQAGVIKKINHRIVFFCVLLYSADIMSSFAKKIIFITPLVIIGYILYLLFLSDQEISEVNNSNTSSANAPSVNLAVDGYFTDWSDWSECNKKCGGGSQGRYRTYMNAKNGGVELDNKDNIIELRSCNTNPCPTDGYLTEFGNWSSCDKPCGGGVVRRSRSYIPAQNGGVDLTDDEIQKAGLVESKPCNTHACPVNGYMTAWSGWSSCDKTCGGGNQTRSRSYVPAQNGGVDLSEAERIKLIESQKCNTNPCPVNGYMGAWSNWSACSASCGGGTQNRSRAYTPAQNGGVDLSEAERIKLIETQQCNTNPCPENGYLTAWSDWSDCDKNCGTGIQTRTRSYISAKNGGTDLSLAERSNLSESRNCNTHVCPVNGSFTAWSAWSSCDKKCGSGTQQRTRTYVPASNGGVDLSTSERSKTTETQNCNTFDCPGPDIDSKNLCSSKDGGNCQSILTNGVCSVDMVSQDAMAVKNYNSYYPWSSVVDTDKRVKPYRTAMQSDGNLVRYNANNTPVWASGTDGKGTGPYYATITSDCDFGVFDKTGTKLWSSGTAGKTYWSPGVSRGEVCFDGDSYITLSNDCKKLVKDIEIGDCVKTAVGSNAIVEYIVKTDIEDKLLCNINNMWITPWHPIFVNKEWKYPKDITKPKENKCSAVYSLAISNGHAVFINDIIVATLGHEFKDDVVKHEYFGSKKVIKDLEKLSNMIGSKIIKNPKVIRCNKTKEINGLCWI